jgi:HJR/Mrr/RecB family endonuclease
MQWAILVVIGIIWILSKAFEGASNINFSMKQKQSSNEERLKKYRDRFIDPSKSLFDRNIDIIEQFGKDIDPGSYRSYYIDNKTRDCINEICLAEGEIDIRPGSTYLSNWRNSSPTKWRVLSQEIENYFREKKNKIFNLDRRISEEKTKLDTLKNKRKDPLLLQNIVRSNASGNVCIEQVVDILTPNLKTWIEIENEIEKGINEKYNEFSLFLSDLENTSIKNLNEDIVNFNNQQKIDIKAKNQNKLFFKKITDGYSKKIKDDVVRRLDYIINNINLPDSIPKVWAVDFNPEQQIAIVEISLPDVVHNQIYKKIELKNGVVEKPLTQKEAKEKIPNIHPAIILRVAFEVFRNDSSNTIKFLVVNGWVEYDDPATGIKAKTYTASLAVERNQIINLNLSKLEPLSAFTALKGKSAGRLIDIIPVSPLLSLDRKDKRFIETKEVLSKLDNQTNLASMDWQDFENLIAELFQKEFAEEGTEIKLTQSSRDKGVDAVVINNDPIRGGKYIIQAKRYTNTVDVSAVRDLVAVVAHEGASRGILVTTSTYGADAYAFVQNKPITLLDGSKLLGLLEKHGYKFRINIAEARKLYKSNQKY